MTSNRELVLAGSAEEFDQFCLEYGKPVDQKPYYVDDLDVLLSAPEETPFWTYGTWYLRDDADTLLKTAHQRGLTVMRTR